MQINTLSRSGFKSYAGPLTDESGLNHRLQFDDSSLITALKQPPVFSKDGKFIALLRNSSSTVDIQDCSGDTRTSKCELPCPEAQVIEFSPRGTYVIVWSRPTKPSSDGETSTTGNLQIWRVADGTLAIAFFQKVSKRDVVQWTEDERLMFHLVTNEVQIFAGDDIGRGIIAKVHHKGVTLFKASPVSNPAHIAVFTPEASGKPARVNLYKYEIGKEVTGPGNSRSMFAATDATCLWNSTGDSVLVHTHTDVDNSNTSYYGATGLSILTTDGAVAAMVSQSKEGPVHEVKWAPDGLRFVICAGNMPCQTTMYSSRGDPVYEFGAAHRNTISWSPHGRFLCIAGFGNLAGEMDFYDTVKLKKIGSNAAHCTVSHGWSADSRYFLTAVLAPRMNVDNGFRVFKYNGVGPVVHHQQNEDPLYFAAWHPRDSQLYPNRGQSPKRTDANASSVATTVSAPAAKPTPAPYRPPGSTGALADMLRREAAPVGKIKPAGEAVAQKKPVAQPAPARRIPGMAPSSAAPQAPSASQKKAADKKPATAPAAQPSKPATPPAAPATASAEPAETNPAARLKNLRKRIKQIQEIRAKLAAEPDFKPNVDQLNKLASEPALLAEIAELEAIVK